ncbi:MAG: DTW domain-containing protein [Candidatus Brocadiales bacterium]|nr:DTW domain-containing protein [Candidatus Brocadiales bacterium]
MSKSKQERCLQCRLVVQECICSDITPLLTEHRLTLLTNKREEHIHSNTGRLLRLMLENNSLIYIGEKGWERKVEEEIVRIEYTPVIFFPITPFSDGQEIIEENGKPLNIIVLDTNWSSARRWLYKLGSMEIKKIGLRKVPPSKYYLRKQSKEGNLCTFQAVTSLLEELETRSSESATSHMNEIFALWVKSMAKERGLTFP